MEAEEAGRLWARIAEELRRRVRGPQFETWFSRALVSRAGGGIVEIAVPSAVLKEWIDRSYAELLQASVAAVAPGMRPLVVVGTAPAPGPAPAPSPPGAAAGPGPVRSAETEIEFRLNDQYVFENFVVGLGNEIAHNAAWAVADAPGRAYNPLFLHGSVGLGKTHLLQAIAHHVLRLRPGMRILYLPCEAFTNQFVAAVAKGSPDRFRSRFRNVDVLLIDDIHFLASKERTQEEFFHTFNTLFNCKKQIVLSSDSPPKEIPTLEERLVSRFEWGMVTEIEKPTLEDRVAILKRKALARAAEVPDAVLMQIAQRVDSNIRELEGTLSRVLHLAKIRQRPPDLAVAAEALRNLVKDRPRIRVEEIQDAVVQRFNVRVSDLQSKRRSRSIVLPRQIGMHLARVLTDHSLEEIGGFFGGRDHTTVLYADEQIRIRMRRDESLRALVDNLASELRNRSV